MSDPASGLSADAVNLLLTVLEAPEARVSGAALAEFFPDAGRALIGVGALAADGYDSVATSTADHDDAPVTLSWRDDVGGYAFFSPSAGWVAVENERLVRYRADFTWVLRNVARQIRVLRTVEPRCVVDGHLWEVGPAWIGHRRHMTPVWLGRRLGYPGILSAAASALRHRTNGRTGLLLITGTGLPSCVTMPGNPVVASIRNCLAAGAGFRLDAGILASLVGGNLPARGQQPLEIIGDGRTVWFYGEKYEFPRGDKQRRVIGYLHEQYVAGVYEVPQAQIVADLELADNIRIDKLFKGSPAWNRLLTMRTGMCAFCWPDEDRGTSRDEIVPAD
jgi:hypothetical protein